MFTLQRFATAEPAILHPGLDGGALEDVRESDVIALERGGFLARQGNAFGGRAHFALTVEGTEAVRSARAQATRARQPLAPAWPRVVVPRNGDTAIVVSRKDRADAVPILNRSASALRFSARARARDAGAPVIVAIAPTLPHADPAEVGLPTGAPDLPALVAECAIGDRLDRDGGGLVEAEKVEVECFGEFFRSLESREPASDDEVTRYLAAKTYWAWKHDLPFAHVTYADQLRLAVQLTTIEKLARVDVGELWEFAGAGADGFALGPTQRLLRDARAGRLGVAPSATLLDARGRLTGARYAGVKAHLDKAWEFHLADAPDYENSAKEAVTALESMARIVAGAGATLGEALAKLRNAGRLHPALAKSLEGVWGYTNAAPGVRHGGTTPPSTLPSEAQLVVNLAAGAILYLVELDAS